MEPIGCQDVLGYLWGELVFGMTPESGKAKLCIAVHRRFFENALSGMEKLVYKRVVESRLPFLDESKIKASIIFPVSKMWNWSPHVQIVVLLPVTQSQFSMDKQSWVSWKNFLERLYLRSRVWCTANIEFGLHVHDARETNVDAEEGKMRVQKDFGP